MSDSTPRGPTSATLASPKLVKQKPNPALGSQVSVAFGCEHAHAFHKSSPQAWKTLCSQYNSVLKSLNMSSPAKSQTVRLSKESTRPSLRPSYLCLQCPNIFTEDGMKPHFEGPKAHSLFVESRSGYVFCNNCEDFIYDPYLEQLRVRSKYPRVKKRKFDDYAGIESSPLVAGNSAFVPCRAIGLRGLYNMGNTCFMSVVIQSLLHNPFIKSWYLSEGHKSQDCERDACTSCAMDEIFSEFWSSEKTEGYGAVPMLLSSWKASEQLAGYQQQDAHEYMQFILNSLHSTHKPGIAEGEAGDVDDELHDNTDTDCDCVIHKTFYGKLQSTVTCNECKNKTTALDPFMDLSLDLKLQAKKRKKDKNAQTNGETKDEIVVAGGGISDDVMRLEECLARFTGEEKLAKEDYRCVKCDRQRDAVKQLSIRKCPPVLTIHLKRFSHSKDKPTKVDLSVSFPMELDMVPYTAWHQKNAINGHSSVPTNHSTANGDVANGESSSANSKLNAEATYLLSAVIVHKGDINSGHYVSYAREGKDWFLFDDSKVVLVGDSEVLGAEAYLLVYVMAKV
ncbi:uncharacterized protein PV09_08555 [Verruconis gallopava]|uniref:Ubiquitin carboxyl-terminal hydrolase n=1 Tax=Verruconis gallopava TaxID=253628 RepID=A0A0D1ZZP3_9PEZI|nr:uncharacterized protein PV09_08555 [Verruconis gallopava]KIV99892.1 hypothetical protein PV09_08555 [Verruconis gallopava]